MSIQITKDLIHQKVEATNDSTLLMFYLYVANQLLTNKPDYTFLDEADLNQLVNLSYLIHDACSHSKITSTVIDKILIERTPTKQ